MLDAVAELRADLIRHIERVLRHEINTDALRADQANNLLDAFQQRGRGVVEQEMRLIEEEDELGLFSVAHFRQRLEKLGEHPEKVG